MSSFSALRACRVHFPLIKRIQQWQPIQFTRLSHNDLSEPSEIKVDSEMKSGLNSQPKYKLFRDEDATVIFDIEEERQKLQLEEPQDGTDAYTGLNLKRGIHGVYDIEDLVATLQRENGLNIFVCTIPKQFKYVDYMCIVTGRSYRHMLAMAEFIRKVYKMKRNSGERIPKIEGEKCRDWLALDLGNIALHIFSGQARKNYDLESLWSLGPEFDKECNKPEDPILQLFEKNTIFLGGLEPKDSNSFENVELKSQ